MISHKQKILASAGIFFVVSVAGAVSVAKAVYMPSAFQCFAFLKKRNVILNLFQHLIPLFLFLGLISLS